MSLRVNHETHTLEFERTLDTTPTLAFEAWTDAAQVTEWWDPSGAPLVSCTIDLRPSGTFRFETKGHAPPFTGTYRAVEPPARLEFDAMGAFGVVTFTASGGATHMRVTIRCASAEHLQMFVKLGVDEGTDRTLDNLTRFVAQHAAAE